MKLIFDLEGDGLYHEVTQLWCGVTYDVDTEEVVKYRPNELNNLIDTLMSADLLIGHNIIEYDLPVIEKLYGRYYRNSVIDTFVWSSVLRPTRQGGHSIEAWSHKYGMHKVENEDWSKFTEHMLERCASDVMINVKVYGDLIQESGCMAKEFING